MNATLAAWFPLEVLHDVRDVDAIAGEANRLERMIEQTPRRSHERAAGQILCIARLLADEHHVRVPLNLKRCRCKRTASGRPLATGQRSR